jgi:hypothetical protein
MNMKKVIFARLYPLMGNASHLEDMLRYDIAFQYAEDPLLIAFPVFQTKSGNMGGRITQARWESFGVRISVVNRQETARLQADLKPEEWITYRNIRDELKSFTLAQYLTVADTRELEALNAK